MLYTPLFEGINDVSSMMMETNHDHNSNDNKDASSSAATTNSKAQAKIGNVAATSKTNYHISPAPSSSEMMTDPSTHPVFSAMSAAKLHPDALLSAKKEKNKPTITDSTTKYHSSGAAISSGGLSNYNNNRYFNVPDDVAAAATAACAKAVSLGTILQRSQQNAFLYDMFDIISDSGTNDVIRWLSHGKGFIISDKGRFEREILPNFLPNIKFSSFTRRLKRWNFFRVPSGAEIGAYYHKNFQRGKQQLIHLINTDSAPPIDLDAENYPTYPMSPKKSPSIPYHDHLYTKIKLPPSNTFGKPFFPVADANSCGDKNAKNNGNVKAEDQEEITAESGKNNAKKDDGDKNIIRDVRDFPQIMREISKAKRLVHLAAKRQSNKKVAPFYQQEQEQSCDEDPFEPIPYSPRLCSSSSSHQQQQEPNLSDLQVQDFSAFAGSLLMSNLPSQIAPPPFNLEYRNNNDDMVQQQQNNNQGYHHEQQQMTMVSSCNTDQNQSSQTDDNTTNIKGDNSMRWASSRSRTM